MPANPAILKAISTIRKAINEPVKKKDPGNQLYFEVDGLFRKVEMIVKNPENLDAVLALAPEIEAFRGKGGKMAARLFSMRLCQLPILLKELLPSPDGNPDVYPTEDQIPDSARHVVVALEKLATHAFQRVHGPAVRSLKAGVLREDAWRMLGEITAILHRPEHLAHAFKVAEDPRAASGERQAAIGFVSAYWEGDEPDVATVDLLERLQASAPDRDFLMTVVETQIELGLQDELGAMFAVEDWEDEE